MISHARCLEATPSSRRIETQALPRLLFEPARCPTEVDLAHLYWHSLANRRDHIQFIDPKRSTRQILVKAHLKRRTSGLPQTPYNALWELEHQIGIAVELVLNSFNEFKQVQATTVRLDENRDENAACATGWIALLKRQIVSPLSRTARLDFDTHVAYGEVKPLIRRAVPRLDSLSRR